MGATASIDNPDSVWELVAKIKAENPGNRCTKYLTKEYYDSLSPEQQAVFQKCVRTGIDNSSSGLGCYAMQPADYETFAPFFDQVRCLWLIVCILSSLFSLVFSFLLLRKNNKASFPPASRFAPK
jgi:hypothetical protein